MEKNRKNKKTLLMAISILVSALIIGSTMSSVVATRNDYVSISGKIEESKISSANRDEPVTPPKVDTSLNTIKSSEGKINTQTSISSANRDEPVTPPKEETAKISEPEECKACALMHQKSQDIEQNFLSMIEESSEKELELLASTVQDSMDIVKAFDELNAEQMDMVLYSMVDELNAALKEISDNEVRQELITLIESVETIDTQKIVNNRQTTGMAKAANSGAWVLGTITDGEFVHKDHGVITIEGERLSCGSNLAEFGENVGGVAGAILQNMYDHLIDYDSLLEPLTYLSVSLIICAFFGSLAGALLEAGLIIAAVCATVMGLLILYSWACCGW